jgi:hypothetical protein
MFSKWIDHMKSYYINKDLVKKPWIAKDILFHLSYDPVPLLTGSNHRKASNNNNYRDMTKREINAYRNALHRIRIEESMTKSKGR